ncbi:MAG TPA: sodium ion-translocating decarboxylase subunit beta [Candidatus Cloacimonetes bacterium]|jgi:oxaloacetate decarboxylase beta subunit|nr:glutaconyl-CoA decarboxylase subunit beta [Candidatus Cloacimonas sp.]HHZ15987.1 sodium ion-translocating decarboxylase subunit beta [Candidatus Cloacimonadota bacterium]
MEIITRGLSLLTWEQVLMMLIGVVLIWLAIAKKYEPALLLPIGFGTILANIPLSAAVGEGGALTVLFDAGIRTELFPLLIFIAIGAMIDFSPLLQNPSMLLFGAAAQLGIFVTIALATLFGFSLQEAGAIGIIGAADGPTSIYVANRFAPSLMGPISVAAYSYMALVPIIQPPIIRLLTTKEERKIRMDYSSSDVPKIVKIIFPILITVIAGILVPESVSLIGFLMFGNLIRECGVLESLSKSAQNELGNLVTILLGITVASTMKAEAFLRVQTIFIMLLGLVAFVFDTAGGVLFAKLLNLIRKKKINPMIGACGISAFPMSARVVHQMGQKEDPFNFLLMPAVSVNVGGQIGSVIAGGLVLALLS